LAGSEIIPGIPFEKLFSGDVFKTEKIKKLFYLSKNYFKIKKDYIPTSILFL